MANWLQKLIAPPAPRRGAGSLPATRRANSPLTSPLPNRKPDPLPNASVIYGMAASALFVAAVYFLFTGMWFTGVLVLLPALCFLGFALYFLRHPN